MNGAKVASERRHVRKKLVFQTAISQGLSNGADLPDPSPPPPGVKRFKKVPGFIGLTTPPPAPFHSVLK